jgi:MoxR-like ATPase
MDAESMSNENLKERISLVVKATEQMKTEIKKIIVGQETILDMLLVALLADGHVLLEGVPGIAKTLLAKLMAKTLSVDFSRIQFTPDLMPADILGTLIFNAKKASFEFKRGPLFSNIILIDEINRAPAKTQAALFEVMEERQISVDVNTYPMDVPYLVLATQNPIEQEGTYKLPEAQLDRFIFRLIMDYPDLEEEKTILKKFLNERDRVLINQVNAVVDRVHLDQLRKTVNSVTIQDSILDYIAQIVHMTRHHGDLFLGASSRASLAIMHSSKALAAMSGRYFVIPEDIQQVSFAVLNHRIILNSERDLEGISTRAVIENIISSIEIPR